MKTSLIQDTYMDDLVVISPITSEFLEGGKKRETSKDSNHEMAARGSSVGKGSQESTGDDASAKALPSAWSLFVEYWSNWTEDGIGMVLGLVMFCITSGCAMGGKDISQHYSATSEWPLGAVVSAMVLIYLTHKALKKPMVLEAYGVIFVIALCSRSLGNYPELAKYGLSASLWGILLGVLVRSSGFRINSGILGGEFFVKVGVVSDTDDNMK
jgi:hypothetical protein